MPLDNEDKIKKLLYSNNEETVIQGLALLDALDVQLDDVRSLFKLRQGRLTFYDLYEIKTISCRVEILEWLIEFMKSEGYSWANDIDQYIRIPWTKTSIWPDVLPLSKTIMSDKTNIDSISEELLLSFTEFHNRKKGKIWLVSKDFQITEIDQKLFDALSHKYPTVGIFSINALDSIEYLFDETQVGYQHSFQLQKLAKESTSKDVLALLICSPYKWVRDAAISNPNINLSAVILQILERDYYTLEDIFNHPHMLFVDGGNEIQHALNEIQDLLYQYLE